MKDNIGKLTFFENIYYWLWHIAPNQSKNWKGTKANFSCTIFSVFRVINIFWIIIFLSYTFQINILKKILNDKTDTIAILITIVPIFFILLWYDEKKFEKRANKIALKAESLNKKERYKNKIVFIIYIITSIAVYAFTDNMIASYITLD